MERGVSPPARGRGAAVNPAGRFERLGYEPDGEPSEEGGSPPATQLLRDDSRSVISRNESPDVGMRLSVNPHRGCEHGCSYCFARPTHEYLGLSAGLDFETRIFVKEAAPELLASELAAPRYEPEPMLMSGVTDPYQPAERRLLVTRRCLEVIARFRQPVCVLSKSELVARDADLLADLAKDGAAAGFLSITTLDPELSRLMEPRASTPERRLAALSALRDSGVPCGVMVAPVVPGLTDHELPAILKAARRAGASRAGYIVLRLPWGVKELFTDWLERVLPERASKVLARVREMRGGALYDPRFGKRLRGEGVWAEQLAQLFRVCARREGFAKDYPPLSAAAFRRPGQLTLF